MKRVAVFTVVILWAAIARAHKPSDSYLVLRQTQSGIQGQWDIALRDLDYAIGLDIDNDGAITWGELRARHDAIAAYALARLHLQAGGGSCSLRPTEHLVDSHTDGAYAVLRFVVNCPGEPTAVDLRYSLLFDLDPQHRGLLRFENEGEAQTALLSPTHPTQHLEVATISAWRSLLGFWRDGVRHSWFGFDHILFLLALLTPAVLRRESKHWRGVSSFEPAFSETLKIVTAFTVAHSITLSLTTLGTISVPSRLVASGIALSIVVAAVNNAYPFFEGRRWLVGFGFGLLHGCAFASVLANPAPPHGSLLLALLGFNTGVETGQLVVVSVFLPLAYAARCSWGYQRVTVMLGSSVIALLATIWLVEQALNLRLLAS